MPCIACSDFDVNIIQDLKQSCHLYNDVKLLCHSVTDMRAVRIYQNKILFEFCIIYKSYYLTRKLSTKIYLFTNNFDVADYVLMKWIRKEITLSDEKIYVCTLY